MAGFLKKLTSRGKSKNTDDDDAASIRSAFGGEGQISAPAQAHYRAQRQGHELNNPGATFAARVAGAGLDQMTIGVNVWRLGNKDVTEEEEHLIVASRFLKRDYEHLSHLPSSYNYYSFIAAFEKRIGERDTSETIEMMYGKLDYEHSSGEWRSVRGQQDFEVALSNLLLNRGGDDVLRFVFQPESREARTDRLAKAVGEQSDAFGASTPTPSIFEHPISEDAAPEASRVAEPAVVEFPPTPEATPGKPAGPSRISGASAASAGRPSTPLSPSSQRPTSSGSGGVRRSGSIIQKVGSRLAGRPSISEGRHLSTPNLLAGEQDISPQPTPGASPNKPSLSVGASLKKAINTATGVAKKQRETREEERERFKTLFEEEGRVTFKRGGDDAEEDNNANTGDAGTGVEEVESPEPNELDEEDDEVPQEDRVIAKLQNLQHLPDLSQLDGPSLLADDTTVTRWEECCRLFRRDPEDTQLESLVQIAGLKTAIYQYQAFGVYWQMANSRHFGGGFLADDMGLGKTLSFLAYIVVERQLSVLWREVRKSREAKDGKHLTIDEQSDTAQCPSRPKNGWIACPCSKLSPSALMVPQPGLRMACVPSQLVPGWWAQWKSHIDTSDGALAMKIVVDSPVATGMNATMEDRNSSSSHAQNRTRMKSATYGSKPGEKKGSNGNDHPKEYQEGYLLLTTKESFPKFMKEFQTEGQVHDSKRLGEWKKGIRTSLVFGIAMIDESHEEYFRNKGRAEILTKLPTNNNPVRPFLWGYSGTPFSQTPRGLEGVLWAIEKHAPQTEPDKTGWATSPRFRDFQWSKLDNICKLFDEQVKSKDCDDRAVNRILEAFKPFLKNFMIRRTADTQWFGHSLIRLKPHIHQDVSLKQNKVLAENIPTFEAQFQNERDQVLEVYQMKWDEFPESRRSDIRPSKLGFNTECRFTWRSRILATFPWLWKLTTPERDAADRLTLTEEEALGFRGSDQKEKATPYGKYLKNIVEGSPKCVWLYNYIHYIDNHIDVNGNEEKLIILTQFPQVAFILKLFFQKYFPEKKDRIGMIVGRMKAREKNDIINAFTDALDEKQKRKTKANFQILIGTSRYVGVGLHLTRATNLVLMEPDYDFARELQGYHRIHRIGQQNPMTRSFRLIDAESEIEQRILKRQKDRNEFPGRMLSGSEVERSGFDQHWILKKQKAPAAAFGTQPTSTE